MTVPVSVSLPSPTAGKAATAAAAATGKAKGLDAAAVEASGVADMFAALVATLTAQMQPTSGEAAGEEAAATAPGLTAAGTGAIVDGFAPGPQVAAALTAEATPAGATPAEAELNLEPGMDNPDLVLDGEAPDLIDSAPLPDADDVRTGARAVPAQPATPASREGDIKLPATPAVPAQPANRAGDEAAPVNPVLPTHAAPAAHAATANAAAGQTPPATDTSGDEAVAPVVNPAASTPAAARAEGPAPTAPVAPPPPADAHVQVARVVRPLRLSDDGAYELALDLTPAELGRVRIDVELRGATIHLNLRADNPATRDLLQDSLQQLRRELEAAGLQAGSLDVGGRGSSAQDNGTDRSSASLTSPGDTEDVAPLSAAPTPTTDTLTDDTVDVRA